MLVQSSGEQVVVLPLPRRRKPEINRESRN